MRREWQKGEYGKTEEAEQSDRVKNLGAFRVGEVLTFESMVLALVSCLPLFFGVIL